MGLMMPRLRHRHPVVAVTPSCSKNLLKLISFGEGIGVVSAICNFGGFLRGWQPCRALLPSPLTIWRADGKSEKCSDLEWKHGKVNGIEMILENAYLQQVENVSPEGF